MHNFFQRICTFSLLCLFTCLLLTGCGPSEEKIAEAQNTYTELINTHNRVVDAHKTIATDKLDKDLTALTQKLEQMDDFNLNEMKDEEIDSLTASMKTLISTYEEFETSIAQLKANEEASVIITLPISLTNQSGLTFTSLTLYQKGDSSSKENILAEETTLGDGQHITGLFIYRDVSNTPWILELEDADANTHKLELPVKNYSKQGQTIVLSCDSETGQLKFT